MYLYSFYVQNKNMIICISAPRTAHSIFCRVRPIPFWRPIPDTIGRSCTDTHTDTDTGNDITYSLGQTYLTYVAHTVCTFQNITPLTLRFETFETDYRLETIGVRATVLTVETGK